LVAWLYTDTVWYVQDPKGPHVDRESRTVGFGPEVTSDYSAYVAQTAKIVGVSDDMEAVAACEKLVQQELGDHVSAARSQPYYLDITHPAANKGSVVDFLSAVYLIPSSSIATLGDMPNECPDVQTKRLGFAAFGVDVLGMLDVTSRASGVTISPTISAVTGATFISPSRARTSAVSPG